MLIFAPWNFSSLFSVVFFLHCFDCTQIDSIVTQLLEKGATVEKGTNLFKKNGFWAKKPQRNGFFGVFSHISALYRSVILLQCSDDTQTYRIVAHFTLKCGKAKTEPQKSSQFLFTTSENSRVSRSWFSLRETLSHFSQSYFYCIASIALKLTV